MRIALINGPNLNLLGLREPEVYGRETLQDLENMARRHAQTLGIEIECYQSNGEGHLIDALHRARLRCQGVIFNPAGYTHTSVALRDAILAIGLPVIEVHLSNPHKREDFRQTMLTTAACVGQVSGVGLIGYEIAITALVKLLKAGIGARPGAPAPQAAPQPAAPAVAERDARGGFDDDREGRRGRRRGRRGGRGRRRDGEFLDGEGRDEATGETQDETSQQPEDIAAKYAHLRGATVRRGMDVLAEGESEPAGAQAGSGSVNFSEAPDEEETAEVSAVGPETSARPERSMAPDTTSRVEPLRRPEPLYGRNWRPTGEPEAQPGAAAGAETHAESGEKPSTPPPDQMGAEPAMTEEQAEGAGAAGPKGRKGAKGRATKSAAKTPRKAAGRPRKSSK